MWPSWFWAPSEKNSFRAPESACDVVCRLDARQRQERTTAARHRTRPSQKWTPLTVSLCNQPTALSAILNRVQNGRNELNRTELKSQFRSVSVQLRLRRVLKDRTELNWNMPFLSLTSYVHVFKNIVVVSTRSYFSLFILSVIGTSSLLSFGVLQPLYYQTVPATTNTSTIDAPTTTNV